MAEYTLPSPAHLQAFTIAVAATATTVIGTSGVIADNHALLLQFHASVRMHAP